MPRGKRLIVPNCPHHIVQRGHDRKAVFICEDDFKNYLTTLEETKKELDVAIYAYCLMTNHVHLIVDPKDNPANLSLLMKKLSEIENRMGLRVESRGQGRPKKGEVLKNRSDTFFQMYLRISNSNFKKGKGKGTYL